MAQVPRQLTLQQDNETKAQYISRLKRTQMSCLLYIAMGHTTFDQEGHDMTQAEKQTLQDKIRHAEQINQQITVILTDLGEIITGQASSS